MPQGRRQSPQKHRTLPHVWCFEECNSWGMPLFKSERWIAASCIDHHKEAQNMLGLFGFGRQHMPHLIMLFQAIYLVSWKAYHFEWDPEQEGVLRQVKALVWVALPLEPRDLADPMIPKISVNNGSFMEPLAIPSRRLVTCWPILPCDSSPGLLL